MFLLYLFFVLEFRNLCYGSHKLRCLELTTRSNTQYENESLSFEMRGKYEAPCVVFFEHDHLEFSSLYDMHMAFQRIVPSLHDICMTYICAPIWDESCNTLRYENASLRPSIPLLYERYVVSGCLQDQDRSKNAVYYENKVFELFPSSNQLEQSMAIAPSEKRHKFRRIRFKPPLYLHFCCFHSCFIFLTKFECKKLEFSFHRHLMKRHDYAVHWPAQCLTHASLSIYSFFIFKRRRGGIKTSKMKRLKTSLAVNDCVEGDANFDGYFHAGGRHQTTIKGNIVYKYLQTCTDIKLINDRQYFKENLFHFEGYEVPCATSSNTLHPVVPFFYSKIPLDELLIYLNMKELRDMSKLHNIDVPQNIQKKTMLTYFDNHHCTSCDLYVSILSQKIKDKRIRSTKNSQIKKEIKADGPSEFPPDPPSKVLLESIINGFCDDTSPDIFVEAGCAVCGRLTPISSMALLNEMNYDLGVISPGNIGRYERLHESDPIISLKGPILAENCSYVCLTCQSFLKKEKMPPDSLANSFWIGSIPLVLQNLTFAEKMLISKIRHNKCLVRVSSGRAKMTANVIMFSNPTVKVYHALPPSRREISEILAFVFQGPIQPTESDIKRTPMLVRRNVVKDALDWLKLNHVDYEELHISLENLNEYPLAGVPVNIEYSKSDPDTGNKIPSAMSVYDNEFEDGTTDGPCPFTVHGLTGPEFENMSMDRLKARALQHLAERGSVLGISHDSKPQSMYDNPQAYPQMFPWLFPYGFGGIGQKCHFAKISEVNHKKKLLMYYDKRFQTDFYFPMVAFNHEQLKAGVTGSFLLAKRKKWPDISNRLKSLNRDVLKKISDQLSDGVRFTPETVEEKKCFQLLNDLDHVGGFVKGSITSKKHMRNEIWSMISQLGAPSWFITLSPADSRHPILCRQ